MNTCIGNQWYANTVSTIRHWKRSERSDGAVSVGAERGSTESSGRALHRARDAAASKRSAAVVEIEVKVRVCMVRWLRRER
eukprot:9458408-Pyramimonas_sp.AAC.1